jgi:argininosuccinate synthase
MRAPSSVHALEDDRGVYDHKDAEGFIRLNAPRLRTLAMRERKGKK